MADSLLLPMVRAHYCGVIAMSRIKLGLYIAASGALASSPVLAQIADQSAGPVSAEEAVQAAAEQWSLIPQEEEDPCADLPSGPDIIVVCEEVVDPEQYMINGETEADSDVSGSGAPRPPDFAESCLPEGEGRMDCVRFGSVPPPAIMVDFDEMAETPEGSEAARLYGGPTTADAEAEEEAAAAAIVAEENLTSPADEVFLGLEDDTFGP